MPVKVDEETIARGLRFLSRRDRELAQVLQALGPPQLWSREPGFASLVHIMLEQQVSLASALAVFNRLSALVSPLTPEGFMKTGDAALRAIGFSRQKIAHVRHLAESIREGSLDLSALSELSDEEVRARLLRIKGIGNWTADIYLLRVLGRPDAWPSGDLALAVAAERIKQLDHRPTPAELEALSLQWRPWRSVAARLLWHYYLNGPKK
jgi:DNA-3-methyladenine glycosylase II